MGRVKGWMEEKTGRSAMRSPGHSEINQWHIKQYTSEDFQRLLVDQGITCGMSRREECWGNAVMERFFSTLKIERVFRSNYKTRDEARADIFDYIERFNNAQASAFDA